MKKHLKLLIIALSIGIIVLPSQPVTAQIAVMEIIKAGVKKVIQAMAE